MHRARSLITVIVLALVALALVAPAQAAPGKPPKTRPAKARITWSTARVEQAVAPGATVTVDVTLTSSADVSDVTFRVPGGLGRVLTVDTGGITSLKAGVATTIRLTIAMPADGAHPQGGVVQVRSGRRALPTPLKVHVSVPGMVDDEAD